jgi:preprotein translocase subunit SecG
MIAVLLAIHVIIALMLIGFVLMQRSEGGALGIGGGGGGGGMSGFMTARGSANLLTRVTAILGALFMATSLALVILGGGRTSHSLLDQPPVATQPATPAAPEKPASPSVPLAK